MYSTPIPSRCVVCDASLEAIRAPSRTCGRLQCRLAYQQHLALGKRTCIVCGRPLQDGEVAARQSTCNSTTCCLKHAQHIRAASGETARRCSVCKVPLAPHRVAIGVCDDRECAVVQGAVRQVDRREKRRQQLQQFREAAKVMRDNQAPSRGLDDPDTYKVAVVPHTSRPLAPSQAERVGALREHLERLVHTASTQPEAPSDAPYSLSELHAEATDVEATLFANACRLCRGRCCRAGEEHAFLSVKSIRTQMARFPDASGEEIVQRYIEHVPDRSIEDSCVFHGEKGCALPREMRSDMCNRWLCPGLVDLRNTLAGGASRKAFIASTGDTQIEVAEFVDATPMTTPEIADSDGEIGKLPAKTCDNSRVTHVS